MINRTNTLIMPIINSMISDHGPLIHAVFQSKDDPLVYIQCLALVDTGASHCVVDVEFIKSIRHNVVGLSKNMAPDSRDQPRSSDHCQLNLSVLDGQTKYVDIRQNVDVIVMDFSQSAHKFIIGRNALEKLVYTYNGKTKSHMLEWD